MVKKYKTKTEWKNLINQKTPTDFEDLCYDLLRNNNFINVKPRGKGGDGGRDHEGEFSFDFGNQKMLQKCWFQCKRYHKTPLNYREFSSELDKANTRGIDRFIVMSNKDMASGTKSEIEKWNKHHKCQASDWTGTLFLDLLFQLPNICQTHFPDEPVPPVVNPKEPKEVIRLSQDVGNRFGIEINLDTKDVNLNNPQEVGEVLKKALLNLKGDVNLTALIYEKCSLFFFAIGQHEDAIAFLNKSLDITPKNTNALLTKGFILEKIDKIDDSNEVYDELFEIEKNNVLALNNKAFNLLRQGKLDDSLEIIEKALEIEPKLIIAIKNKIKVLKALKQSQIALDFLSMNEDAFEKSTELMNEKVDLCIELIDLKQAFEFNEKILNKEPNNITALNNKGVIYEHNAKYQFPDKYVPLALEYFEKVIKTDENYPLGWSNKTVVLMNSSKLFDAEKVIELAYSKFPNSPEVLNKKGVLLLNKKEPKKALKYFNSALKKLYRGEFLLNRAKAKFQIRQYEDTIVDLERLLKYEPENSSAWGLKGVCLKKLRKAFWQQAFVNAKKFEKKYITLLE